MFTIKFYSSDGARQIIREAESFTILRSPAGMATDQKIPHTSDGDYRHRSAEITLHQKGGESCRLDIGDDGQPAREGWPAIFGKAIIENAAGRTTEIIFHSPS